MKAIRFLADLISVILFLLPGLTADSVTANAIPGGTWLAGLLICLLIVYLINRKDIKEC